MPSLPGQFFFPLPGQNKQGIIFPQSKVAILAFPRLPGFLSPMRVQHSSEPALFPSPRRPVPLSTWFWWVFFLEVRGVQEKNTARIMQRVHYCAKWLLAKMCKMGHRNYYVIIIIMWLCTALSENRHNIFPLKNDYYSSCASHNTVYCSTLDFYCPHFLQIQFSLWMIFWRNKIISHIYVHFVLAFWPCQPIKTQGGLCA